MSLPNLLPQKEEKNYNRYLYLIGTRRFLYFQAVAALIVIVLLTASLLYYSAELRNLHSRSANLESLQKNFDGESLQAVVDQQSKDVSAVYSVLKVYPSMSRLLDELVRLVPVGVTLDIVTVSTQGKQTINVNGRAASRDQVVLLTERLQSSEFFDVVYAPLSNLTESENATFTFIISFDTKDAVVAQ